MNNHNHTPQQQETPHDKSRHEAPQDTQTPHQRPWDDPRNEAPQDDPTRHEDTDELEQHPAEEGERCFPDPQIWIASLADYVNGRLHGAWVNASQTPDELEAAARTILATSPEPAAEEWAIHDYDGFGILHLDEYESLQTVSIIARGIAQHGPAFAAWIDHVHGNRETITETMIEDFAYDTYLGHYDTVEAWAEELCIELGYTELAGRDLPATIASYLTIDHAMLARDMQAGGDITVIQADNGGVWIYRE